MFRRQVRCLAAAARKAPLKKTRSVSAARRLNQSARKKSPAKKRGGSPKRGAKTTSADTVPVVALTSLAAGSRAQASLPLEAANSSLLVGGQVPDSRGPLSTVDAEDEYFEIDGLRGEDERFLMTLTQLVAQASLETKGKPWDRDDDTEHWTPPKPLNSATGWKGVEFNPLTPSKPVDNGGRVVPGGDDADSQMDIFTSGSNTQPSTDVAESAQSHPTSKDALGATLDDHTSNALTIPSEDNLGEVDRARLKYITSPEFRELHRPSLTNTEMGLYGGEYGFAVAPRAVVDPDNTQLKTFWTTVGIGSNLRSAKYGKFIAELPHIDMDKLLRYARGLPAPAKIVGDCYRMRAPLPDRKCAAIVRYATRRLHDFPPWQRGKEYRQLEEALERMLAATIPPMDPGEETHSEYIRACAATQRFEEGYNWIRRRVTEDAAQTMRPKTSYFHDAVVELCLQCGEYRKGWKEIRIAIKHKKRLQQRTLNNALWMIAEEYNNLCEAESKRRTTGVEASSPVTSEDHTAAVASLAKEVWGLFDVYERDRDANSYRAYMAILALTSDAAACLQLLGDMDARRIVLQKGDLLDWVLFSFVGKSVDPSGAGREGAPSQPSGSTQPSDPLRHLSSVGSSLQQYRQRGIHVSIHTLTIACYYHLATAERLQLWSRSSKTAEKVVTAFERAQAELQKREELDDRLRLINSLLQVHDDYFLPTKLRWTHEAAFCFIAALQLATDAERMPFMDHGTIRRIVDTASTVLDRVAKEGTVTQGDFVSRGVFQQYALLLGNLGALEKAYGNFTKTVVGIADGATRTVAHDGKQSVLSYAVSMSQKSPSFQKEIKSVEDASMVISTPIVVYNSILRAAARAEVPNARFAVDVLRAFSYGGNAVYPTEETLLHVADLLARLKAMEVGRGKTQESDELLALESSMKQIVADRRAKNLSVHQDPRHNTRRLSDHVNATPLSLRTLMAPVNLRRDDIVLRRNEQWGKGGHVRELSRSALSKPMTPRGYRS